VSIELGATPLSGQVPRPAALLAEMRNPLLRNGHLLTLSSGLTALLGLGYWTVSAWKYDAAAVGSNSAAISMMVLVAAIAQLNLSSAVVRFVPAAGTHTRRFVACVYLVSGAVACVVGVCSLAVVGFVSPQTDFLDGASARAMFVVATVAYTLFVIEDGVLTALHRAPSVVLTNLLFVLMKLVLVVLLAAVMPWHGIFASWAIGLVAVVTAVGVFVFGSAIPRHQADLDSRAGSLPPVRQLTHFVAFDYIGEIAAIAAMTLLPILVIAALGAETNAYFSIAWFIAYALHQVNFNMGTSLVVETSILPGELSRHVRHVLSHTVLLQVAAAVGICLAAPLVLGLFGQEYRAAETPLRLMCLAALPHLVVATALSSARVQRRMWLVVAIQVGQCVLVLPMCRILLPVLGMNGAAVAWLATQCLVAGMLLVRRDLWWSLPDAVTGETAGAR
jgi:O-antigen/teichoic acid export membrane protein